MSLRITGNVQSLQTESVFQPIFDQLIHNGLLECTYSHTYSFIKKLSAAT